MDEYIIQTLNQNADKFQDLFLSIGKPVQGAREGVIQTLDPTPITADQLNEFLQRHLSQDQMDQLLVNCSADFAFTLQKLRIRGAVTESDRGLDCTLRVLPATPSSETARSCPEALQQAMSRRSGLVLISGSTGSGKSTTIAALLQQQMAARALRLVSIEDPIEFSLHHPDCVVTQREINAHVRSFTAGLRDALRQRPDIIFVGELRDAETIEMAITAAETGHLVVSTIHSNSPESAVQRIIDAFPTDRSQQARSQLASNLAVIATQQLIRGPISLSPSFEVLVNTTACAQLIREGKYHQLRNLMVSSKSSGMIAER